MLPFAVLSLSRGLEARLGRAHSPSGGWSGDVGHTAPSHGRFVMRLARVLPPRRRHFWKVIPACMLAFVGWGCATALLLLLRLWCTAVRRRSWLPHPPRAGPSAIRPCSRSGARCRATPGMRRRTWRVAAAPRVSWSANRQSAAMEGIRLGCQPGDDHRRRRSQRLDRQVMRKSTEAPGTPEPRTDHSNGEELNHGLHG